MRFNSTRVAGVNQQFACNAFSDICHMLMFGANRLDALNSTCLDILRYCILFEVDNLFCRSGIKLGSIALVDCC